jgi:hypothetical protein
LRSEIDDQKQDEEAQSLFKIVSFASSKSSQVGTHTNVGCNSRFYKLNFSFKLS